MTSMKPSLLVLAMRDLFLSQENVKPDKKITDYPSMSYGFLFCLPPFLRAGYWFLGHWIPESRIGVTVFMTLNSCKS